MPNYEKFNRRDFLKLTLVSGSIILGSFIEKFHNFRFISSVFATTETDPYFYGTDTSWAVDTKGSNASNFPQDSKKGKPGVEKEILTISRFYRISRHNAGFFFTHP